MKQRAAESQTFTPAGPATRFEGATIQIVNPDKRPDASSAGLRSA